MSVPTPINLTGTAGATLTVDLTFTRTDAQGVVRPVDLTGATVWMTIKVRYADPDPGVAQITSAGSSASGGIVIDSPETNGTATATVADTVFDPYPTGGSYVYDVKVLESNGNESVPISGRLTINPAVTRAS